MKSTNLLKSLAVIATLSGTPHSAVQGQTGKVQFANIENVKVNDAFWSPKFKTWNEVTINDVLNKFEGKHTNAPEQHNAFCNFDKVAKGERGTQGHFGEPWFDGLIYESIRGIADYLVMYPDKELETRIDRYIDRIEAAQMTEPTGYLETYTLLKEPEHRWGDNGGFLRWQHDVYNAGMMIEAAVHYYKATGTVGSRHPLYKLHGRLYGTSTQEKYCSLSLRPGRSHYQTILAIQRTTGT